MPPKEKQERALLIATTLKNLEQAKEQEGSWDKLARILNIPKRNIMRWRKTKSISKANLRLVGLLLREEYKIR